MILPCSAAEPLAGRWEGSVHIPGNDLPLVVDLAPNSQGVWAGSIIIPGLGIKGLSLKDVVVKDTEATFSTKSVAGRGLDATFKLLRNDDGTLVGEFNEGGNTAPFELKPSGPPQVEVPPRSTVVSKEIEGEWVGEFQLFGYGRKVSLKLTNNDKQTAAAEFIVVGKRVNNLPVDLVTQEGNLLSIYSHETGITFEGKLRTTGGEIRGTFVQGPFEAPLVLHRKS